MKTKTKIIISLCIFIFLLFSYLFLDYTNTLNKISLDIGNINSDLFSIFITNLVVITLYLITYFMVDEKNAKARKNKKEILKYMLEDDYETCLRYLKLLEDKKQLKIIIKNMNKDSYLNKNEYFNNWMEVSFKNYNSIMEYSNQGVIDVDILKKYLYIKSNYSYTMSGYVLADGMPNQVEKIIEEGHMNLKKYIEEELINLNEYNWE